MHTPPPPPAHQAPRRTFDVISDLGTLWFTQAQIAEFLCLTRQVVEHHTRRALAAREFSATSMRTHHRRAADGKHYLTRHYSLEVFFAVAARATSPRTTFAAECWRKYLAAHPELFALDEAA